MMLLLDSEAMSAIAHGPRDRRETVRVLVAEARARERPIGLVASVLAEVVRGRPADAAVFGGLERERIHVLPVDARVGVRAGQLLGRVSAGSEMAVDAFTVAAADLAGGALIATTDPKDLARLAAHARGVVITEI
jgi:predicted nucleic acid-binding protein